MDELELTPQFRVEYFLDEIVNSTDCPYEARDRIEMYLARIAGADIVTPDPQYRIEFYLAKIAGDDVEIPAPQHRAEFYLAALCGEEVELPEPHDRIDYWLYQWAEGGSLPWQTFTGNPLQFNAPKAHTLRSTVVAFSPIQSGSGDPSPDNVRPISGWTGVTVYDTGANVWDEEWEVGAYNSTNGAKVNSNNRIRSKNLIPVSPSTTYYGKIAGLQIYAYGRNKVYLRQLSYTGQQTFITGADCYFITFNTNNSYGETYLNNISINYPSTDTEYHPYTGSTTTLSFPSTVYGGTAEVAEDGTATGSDEWAKIKVGDMEWTYDSVNSRFLSSTISNIIKRGESVRTLNFYCDSFKCISDGRAIGSVPDMSVYEGNGSICIMDSNYTDPDAFKTAMTAVEIVYPLKTPSPFTATPSATPTAVQGINTMWTDGDTLTVEARAEAVNLNALQSLNMLLGGRYVNNHAEEDLSDEEALDVLLGRNR